MTGTLTKKASVKKFLLFLGVMVSFAAHAQIMKCKDPKTGHVTYSDSACAVSNVVTQVQGRRSADDIAADNNRASEARDRLQREAQAAQTRRDVVADARSAVSTKQQNYAGSFECAAARRTQQVNPGGITRDAVDSACYGPEVAAQIKIARAGAKIIIAPPSTPQQMNCRPDYAGGLQCRQ